MTYRALPSLPGSPTAQNKDHDKDFWLSSSGAKRGQISPPIPDDEDHSERTSKRPSTGRLYAQSFSSETTPTLFGATSPAMQALTAIPLSRSKSAGGAALSHTTQPAPGRYSKVGNPITNQQSNTRQKTRRASVSGSNNVRFDHSIAEEASPTRARSSELAREPLPFDRKSNDSPLEAKVVILGSQGVGKTTLVHRYTTGIFSNSLTSTIGASFLTKKIVMPECLVRLQLWDTAGQERFRSMAPIYYRGSQAAVIVYDITNLDSFYDVRIWLDELRNNMTSELIVHVVGAKADLVNKRAVTLEFARKSVKGWISHSSPPPASESTSTTANNSTTSLPLKQATPNARLTGFGASLGGLRRKTTDESIPPSSDSQPWCEFDISEVSAKDDFGIEDLFLHITSRLVARKVDIERERYLRSRDSVHLSDMGQQSQPKDGSPWSTSCC